MESTETGAQTPNSTQPFHETKGKQLKILPEPGHFVQAGGRACPAPNGFVLCCLWDKVCH